MDLIKSLTDRFFRYVSIPSQSDAAVKTVPTSKGQTELANLLADELKDLGVSSVSVDEHSCVYGTLKGNCKGPVVGFLAHLDTVNVSLSPIIHPQIIHYDGGDVVLNKEKNIVLKLSEYPELGSFAGEDIIFSDGTSVLGADDKSAIANIMTMLEVLKNDPSIKHPELKIAFVPDEEIGLLGSKCMDLEKFKVDFAYTIDCSGVGEIVYETFNAGTVKIRIKGVSAHPMSAKNVLVNPLLVAHDFISMFDRGQTPEHTEGREGYWWFSGMNADPLYCDLSMLIRDHDKKLYEWRKQYVRDAVEILKKRYPKAEISFDITDTYENIANNVKREDPPVAMLYQALDELGINSVTYAMRGGTDGSQLSTKGIVTPNYFTGAFNFHSNCEFLPLSSFKKSCEVTLKLIELSCR
ncbi:peptidase T [uncultured Succinivibrio sp.]|uniref:peptidase T n=1 Tax=uncultured Succinivibrio sp. TaxID=540749 RepID=UPI0025D03FD0|nr:peptidase T [uncultured Succinivibrio sp.]